MKLPALLLCLLAVGCPAQSQAAYDPLAVASSPGVSFVYQTVHDSERDREIPVKIYLPSKTVPAPVILFSPGLGGSRDGYAYVGNHWAARGYVVVVLQHPGSDDSVWKNKPVSERMQDMKEAASLKNFMLRAKDVPAVIDQLQAWNRDVQSPLAHRFDLSHIGMAGHSFGAVTTQSVSGQKYFGKSFTDPRITAALMMSPSSPRGNTARAFGSVSIPWMLMTGTQDVSPIGDADVASRLAVYPALPPGGKYELVLYQAEHSAFGDGPLPGDSQPRNPDHHRVILGLSTAFWDTYLSENTDAKNWLDGSGPGSLIATQDHWQHK